MSVMLNHTIVESEDKKRSAEFTARILGLEVGPQYGPFLPVETGNGVTLDFMDVPAGAVSTQHYAFLVSEEEFDEIFARLRAEDVTYYADPFHRRPGEINRNDGGRGTYFADPSGHNLEIITRPYGG
ncbi:VOC family protein [Streptomyces sp. NPDC051940]|uniref:VOC family protein n=1 Tax=Streptomyces sp. NPDC051940 TaxID=3155675 RepID=UPI00344A9171